MDKKDLAIAYAVRKRAAKKMAAGGMVENPELRAAGKGSMESADLMHRSQKPMMDHRSIVDEIVSRRGPNTDGHELDIDENDDTPREVFLTADMPESETGSVHDVVVDEDPAERAVRRRDILRGVMSGMSSRRR